MVGIFSFSPEVYFRYGGNLAGGAPENTCRSGGQTQSDG